MVYFALVVPEKSLGVAKKIDDTVSAANNLNIKSRASYHSTSLGGIFELISSLLKAKEDVIFIRFSDLAFPFLFIILCWLRIIGKKLIIDIPTPRHAGLQEINTAINNKIIRYLRVLINCISWIWVLLPANLIVQYAEESKFFSIGLKSKSLKIGNGILLNSSKMFTQVVDSEFNSKFNLCGVAKLARWHGFDRLISAMGELKREQNELNIRFTVVGDGSELNKLKELTILLGLENDVFFTGPLKGTALDSVLKDSHFGVSSLGLFRIGLNEASVLKTREYMSSGLAVIAAGADPDFDENNPYRLQVNNSEESEELIELLKKIQNGDVGIFNQNDIYDYAKKHLSLESKLIAILQRI